MEPTSVASFGCMQAPSTHGDAQLAPHQHTSGGDGLILDSPASCRLLMPQRTCCSCSITSRHECRLSMPQRTQGSGRSHRWISASWGCSHLKQLASFPSLSTPPAQLLAGDPPAPAALGSDDAPARGQEAVPALPAPPPGLDDQGCPLPPACILCQTLQAGWVFLVHVAIAIRGLQARGRRRTAVSLHTPVWGMGILRQCDDISCMARMQEASEWAVWVGLFNVPRRPHTQTAGLRYTLSSCLTQLRQLAASSLQWGTSACICFISTRTGALNGVSMETPLPELQGPCTCSAHMHRALDDHLTASIHPTLGGSSLCKPHIMVMLGMCLFHRC